MATRAPAPPRVLLVEDDPISLGFFQAALEPLAVRLDCADSMASALALATQHRHALWLIDAHLPDGSGGQLLAALRARGLQTTALAHTADAGASARLMEEGFAEVLVKPLPAQELLQRTRRGLLSHAVFADSASSRTQALGEDWDETAALAALNGERSHLLALRELFLAELPGTRDAVDQALGREDEHALREHLHRLQASCGFVGAARLARAVRALRGDPRSPAARGQFHEAVAALLH